MPYAFMGAKVNRNRAIWEIRNEKNKASVRWVLVLGIGGYLSYLLFAGKASAIGSAPIFNSTYILSILSFAIVFNGAVAWHVHLASARESIGRSVKYITMAVDFLLVALVLVPTGGSTSLLYPLNYVIIVSNALRYGMSVAIAGTLIMNVFYLAVLALQYYPQTEIPGFHQEVLKIAGFWLVGVYTGYLSRRYEILRGEVERYQELLANALKNNAT